VRPREHWWPAFQYEGGRLLNRGLETLRPPRELLSGLDALYLDCRRRPPPTDHGSRA
jgi:hypothetical protein